MIKYISGSLFESKCEVYINPVNCVGVMGAGLAAKFKIKYPKMFQSYYNMCSKNELDVGKVALYTNDNNRPRIICLFPTKRHWKEKSTIDGIERGLVAFLHAHELTPFESAAFPKIGCGLGGLNFEHEVQPLMEHHLGKSKINIEVYI